MENAFTSIFLLQLEIILLNSNLAFEMSYNSTIKKISKIGVDEWQLCH